MSRHKESKEVRRSAKALKRLLLKHLLLGGPRESGYFVSDNRCAIEIPKDTAVQVFIAAGIVPPQPMDVWRVRRGPEWAMSWRDEPQCEERTTQMLENLIYEVHDTSIEIQYANLARVRLLLLLSDDPSYIPIPARYWPLLRKAEMEESGLRTRGPEQPIVGYAPGGFLRLVMPLRMVIGAERLLSPAEMAKQLGLTVPNKASA